MRESIGTVSLLNFIFVYIFIVIAILMGTMSYYKAYRVNNMIVKSIEKFEGYNDFSAADAQNSLGSIGYERQSINCASTRTQKFGVGSGDKIVGNLANASTYTTDGYCVYRYQNDTPYKTIGGSRATTDRYDTFEVVTYMSFDFPFLNRLKIKTSAKTLRIYHFAD